MTRFIYNTHFSQFHSWRGINNKIVIQTIKRNPVADLLEYRDSHKMIKRAEFSTSVCGLNKDKTNFNYKDNKLNNIFLEDINIKYAYNKNNKAIRVSFNFLELERDLFIDRIQKRLDLGCVYTVFIKVRYSIDRYFMVGNQFGFNYDKTYRLDDVYNTLQQRLEGYMEEYDLIEDDIVYIELIFRKKDKSLLSEFSQDFKNIKHLDNSAVIDTNKLINIPISVNENFLDQYLPIDTVDGKITNIKIYIGEKFNYASSIKTNELKESDKKNFLEVINGKNKYLRSNHMDNIKVFDDKYKFYLIKEDKRFFVLAVKVYDENSIDKIKYSLQGTLINRIQDII